ncbi:hypothetical protein AGR13a_Lc30046 [Agrobacterium genomosp. 13 str. CFBP 6927]|uniref:N-acetyltransferase domain-containing protein n=2 Tax=Agrobacterium genomosp. 13 TaxID=1183419 RepID=A0ABM9VL82_9HYPH|nr:hypothetical protein AGR13a_Lc30046 [Agrobacterium genomosp. 13 str. CFBP 6927]
MISWWGERFKKHEFLPKDVGMFLTDGTPGQKMITLDKLDVLRNYTDIEFESADSASKIFFSGRRMDFGNSVLYPATTSVEMEMQGRGIGTTLMANCFRLAVKLNLRSVEVTAIDSGSYVWAKAGFLPTDESWNGERGRHAIKAQLNKLTNVDTSEEKTAREAVEDDDPTLIWSIADLESTVSIPGCAVPIKLSKALLIGSRCSWKGKFDFYDDEFGAEQRARARSYLKIGDCF